MHDLQGDAAYLYQWTSCIVLFFSNATVREWQYLCVSFGVTAAILLLLGTYMSHTEQERHRTMIDVFTGALGDPSTIPRCQRYVAGSNVLRRFTDNRPMEKQCQTHDECTVWEFIFVTGDEEGRSTFDNSLFLYHIPARSDTYKTPLYGIECCYARCCTYIPNILLDSVNLITAAMIITEYMAELVIYEKKLANLHRLYMETSTQLESDPSNEKLQMSSAFLKKVLEGAHIGRVIIMSTINAEEKAITTGGECSNDSS